MTTITDLFDSYFDLQERIYEYFGYKEDWVTIPLADFRGYYWVLQQEKLDPESFQAKTHGTTEGHGELIYFKAKPTTEDDFDAISMGEMYSATIYTQRFLPKWVYRTDAFTLASIDTHCDGNKFLVILDNSKELKAEGTLGKALRTWKSVVEQQNRIAELQRPAITEFRKKETRFVKAYALSHGWGDVEFINEELTLDQVMEAQKAFAEATK